MVDEAKDTSDAGKWTERRAVYERLKAIIDPRPVERAFTMKHGQMFYGLCFAGFLIATNNIDAIQIPAGDRRFAVLANGKRMTGEMAEKLQAWMDQPGNIAALAAWLEARDLRTFKPYDAPETLTKTVMQELSRTEREEAFLTVRKLFGKSALFTGEQFRRAIEREVGNDIARRDDFKPWVRRRLREAATSRIPRKEPRARRRAATSRSEEFRMLPRSDGTRPLILCWRDYEGREITSEEDARGQVAEIDKIIGVEGDSLPVQMRKRFVVHDGGERPA
jgi:hypothetical protein